MFPLYPYLYLIRLISASDIFRKKHQICSYTLYYCFLCIYQIFFYFWYHIQNSDKSIIIFHVCRWISNEYSCQFSRRYHLQQESLQGWKENFLPNPCTFKCADTNLFNSISKLVHWNLLKGNRHNKILMA